MNHIPVTKAQLQARIKLLEQSHKMIETGFHQLEGTCKTFTLVMAAIALKNGGNYLISEAEIDAAGGASFKIDKDEINRCIVLQVEVQDILDMPPMIDVNATGPAPGLELLSDEETKEFNRGTLDDLNSGSSIIIP